MVVIFLSEFANDLSILPYLLPFFILACQADKELILWDIERHVLVRTIQGLGQCTTTYFCLGDSCIATEMDVAVRVLDVATGEYGSLSTSMSLCCSLALYLESFG